MKAMDVGDSAWKKFEFRLGEFLEGQKVAQAVPIPTFLLARLVRQNLQATAEMLEAKTIFDSVENPRAQDLESSSKM